MKLVVVGVLIAVVGLSLVAVLMQTSSEKPYLSTGDWSRTVLNETLGGIPSSDSFSPLPLTQVLPDTPQPPSSSEPAALTPKTMYISNFPPPGPPVVVYTHLGMGKRELPINSVVFTEYDARCENEGEFMITRAGSPRAALELCSMKPYCHSIVCTKAGCSLLSPSCRYKTAQAGYVAYIALERTPKDLFIEEAVEKSLKPLSELKNPNALIPTVTERDRTREPYKPSDVDLAPSATLHSPLFIPVTKHDLRSFVHHVMVDPYHKLVFFLVPKSACSEYLRLYDRLIGHVDFDAHHSGSLVHFKFEDRARKRVRLALLGEEKATRIMNDPSYRKVAFFRDPKERLLSAYLDKFVHHSNYHVRVFKNQTKFTFQDLVSHVQKGTPAPDGVGPDVNPHWRSQVLVGNIYKFLPLFDFVGWGNANHSKAFLEKYGLWEEYGSTGWKSGSPFMQRSTTKDGHGTGAATRMSKYYTPELEKAVEKAYELDYHYFNSLGLTANSPPVTGASVQPHNTFCYKSAGMDVACWPGDLAK